MSLINPVYVRYKYKGQELEGELIPFWSYYFNVDETKMSEEKIYRGYDDRNSDIQGQVRPFDSELRKQIIESNTKIRGMSYQDWCTREDIVRRDALFSNGLSNFYTGPLIISDVELIYKNDLKSPKEEIEKCRQDILDLYLQLLKSMCNNQRNIIEDKNNELGDLNLIYLGMGPKYKSRISKVFKIVFWLAYFLGGLFRIHRVNITWRSLVCCGSIYC